MIGVGFIKTGSQTRTKITPSYPPRGVLTGHMRYKKILVMFLDSIYCKRSRLDCYLRISLLKVHSVWFHVKYTWIYAADVKSRQHLKTKQFGRIGVNSLHVGWVNYHTLVFARLLYAYLSNSSWLFELYMRRITLETYMQNNLVWLEAAFVDSPISVVLCGNFSQKAPSAYKGVIFIKLA